ncbi:retrotransposon nucleocapsid protein [Trichophyton equinum CBS 127.97]|uniref:Retrotransposon nucleocapsid protein n=1 Tax=Trichophyton equinum (strain ATCC MYA-4606 / CBS 127.97) TaxID=559882 RepID=F2Q0Y0_TRIEC|nr:retrotransposon nucleocapsid protein [Trichophyton equinum CBS 127.97]
MLLVYLKARDNQKKYYDRNHLLVSFNVLEKWGSQAYKLKLTPAYNKIYLVFYVSLLEKYKQREGETPPPGSELVDSEEE